MDGWMDGWIVMVMVDGNTGLIKTALYPPPPCSWTYWIIIYYTLHSSWYMVLMVCYTLHCTLLLVNCNTGLI